MTAVRVAVAFIRQGDRFFLQRRDPAAPVLPGLWEGPGGKLEPGETPLAGLLRELQEEVAWTPAALTALPPVVHRYPGREVELHPFLCTGSQAPRTALAWGWFTPAGMAELPTPAGNSAIFETWKNYL